MPTLMRHYVHAEGVYLHVGDLENSLRRIAHTLPEGDYRRGVETVAGAMHEHKARVLEDSVSRLFAGGLR